MIRISIHDQNKETGIQSRSQVLIEDDFQQFLFDKSSSHHIYGRNIKYVLQEKMPVLHDLYDTVTVIGI